MPDNQTELLLAIGDLKKDVALVQQSVNNLQDLPKKVDSLEHSRTRYKTWMMTAWGAIAVLGWDRIEEFLRGP